MRLREGGAADAMKDINGVEEHNQRNVQVFEKGLLENRCDVQSLCSVEVQEEEERIYDTCYEEDNLDSYGEIGIVWVQSLCREDESLDVVMNILGDIELQDHEVAAHMINAQPQRNEFSAIAAETRERLIRCRIPVDFDHVVFVKAVLSFFLHPVYRDVVGQVCFEF